MVEQRKLINQKATSFASRTEEVTLENKEEFEEIVGWSTRSRKEYYLLTLKEENNSKAG